MIADQDQAEDDPERGEVALDERGAGSRGRASSSLRRARPRSPPRSRSCLAPPLASSLGCSFSPSSSPTPVIAPTTCSSVVSSASNSPAALAEPEDEDPVGDLEDVGQVVADHDDAEVALAQAPDQLQHLFGLRRRRAPRSARRAARPSARRAASGRPRPAGAGRRRGCRPRCAGSGSSPPGWRAGRRSRAPSSPRRAGARPRPGPATISSRPRKRLATTSRLSQRARSW